MHPNSTASGTAPDRSRIDATAYRRRRRWLIALVILVPALAAVEVVVRRWERPKATLEVINGGDTPMQDLVVTYGDSRIPVGTIARGQSVRLRMTAGPMGRLRLDYRQKNNPIQSFSIEDYEPRQNLEDGYKFVVVLQASQVQRYAEEDEAPDNPEAPWTWFKRWVQDQFTNSIQ